METRRFADIVAFRGPGGRTIGFHSRNLELASLSTELWDAMSSPSPNDTESEILQDLRAWNEETNPLTRPPVRRAGVRSLTINVTQVCNLHCTYCAAGGDGTYGDPIKRISVEKTIPFLIKFIEQVPAGETFQITFLGGEPLLYPEGIRTLAEVALAQAEKIGILLNFVVVTNGTLFTDENIQLLNDIGASITISLDGPAEINDRVRPSAGGKGVTDQIVAGISRLVLGRTNINSIGVSGVFGANNLEVVKAYEFFRGLNVDWFDFTYDHTETRSEVSQAFTQQVIEAANLAYARGGELELRKIKLFDTYFNLLDHQQRVENFCGSGKHFVMMDAANNLYSCPWKVGSPKESIGHGNNIWEDKIADLKAPLVEANNCQSCWARYLCGGGCMFIHENKTGSKHQVDENFCDRTRLLIKQTLVYYEISRVEERNHEKSEENSEKANFSYSQD